MLKKQRTYMNIKDVVTKIKTFLQEEIAADEQVNFTDIKSNDGTILSFDGELKPGIEIFVVDETGRNPAPDGVYSLEDGTNINILDGKVDTIEMPQEPIETEPPETETPSPAGPMMPDASGKTSGTTMSEVELTDRISKLEADNVEIKTILSQLAESMQSKVFEKEVKMSMVENKPKEISSKIEKKPLNSLNKNLDGIFNNMYNHKIKK